MNHETRRLRGAIGACMLGAALTGTTGHARALDDAPEQVAVTTDALAAEAFELDDENPERSVPTMEQAMRRPLQMGYFVMLLVERGEAATKRGDHAAAVRYYRALVKALPERSKGYSLLCRAQLAQGDAAGARTSCRAALGKAGVTLDDNVQFVKLVLDQPTLAADDVADVEAVAGHVESQLTDGTKGARLAAELRCDLASRLEDMVRLHRCTTELERLAPRDAKTLAYSFALALGTEDLARAASIVTRAERIGLPPDAIATMTKALDTRRSASSSMARVLGRVGAGAWSALLGAACLAAAFVLGRRRKSVLAS